MHKRTINTFVFFWVLLACVPGAAVHAEFGDDRHVQETGEITLDVDRRAFEEFKRFYELGFPPATVMMYAVSQGMSIADAVYIAVKSDVDRAREFHDTAVSLLPSLPGWACQAGSVQGRYLQELRLDELGSEPSIAAVATAYFEQDRRLAPFPDWQRGQHHLMASTAELVRLTDANKYWYAVRGMEGSEAASTQGVIPVSLYKHDRSILVDPAARDMIQNARRSGLDRLPVVIVYNRDNERYISDYQPGVSVKALAGKFFGESIELTPVPEWHAGDFHKLATLDELREVVEFPRREDISDQRWQAIVEELKTPGPKQRPLLLTLLGTGDGRLWVDEPYRLTAAEELGLPSLPVVFFYHNIDRRPCGAAADCEDQICDAAEAAGADRGICESAGADQGASSSPQHGEMSSTAQRPS